MARFLFIFVVITLFSVNKLSSQNQRPQAKEINLYINCQAYCDIDYIKTEIKSVNYVLDRFEANVHLLIISEGTGSGQKINMFFEGQKEFFGINDTLTYFVLDTETSDIMRQKMVSMLKIGLFRYFTFTPMLSELEIKLPDHDTIKKTDNLDIDKWKSWIFNIGTGGNISKDDYQSSKSIRNSFSFYKTTEDIKISSYNSMVVSQAKWIYDDEVIIVNRNRGYSSNQIVFSLGPHFSAGGNVSTGYDQYNNYKMYLKIIPAIEYDFFPYKESVKKLLTFNYSVGPAYSKYNDTSYYNISDSEWLFEQNLSANATITQKWGNIYLSGGWNTFLNNFVLEGKKIPGMDINSFWIYESFDIQILKGLSISLSSSFSYTKGVIPNIPKKDFTKDDLITNSRVYPTSKNLYFYWGVNYRFGSKSSNVVNPRFNSGGGMIFYSF